MISEKRIGEAVTSSTPDSSCRRMRRDALDDALVEQIAAGDIPSMKVLYVRHNVRIYRFILSFTNSKALAEELLNEVFLKVWKTASTFDRRCAVSTWLLAIARNAAPPAIGCT